MAKKAENKYLQIRKKRLQEQGIKWFELDKIGRIEVNPQILCGKPIIRGTRIAVEHVLGWVANKMTEKEIVQNYPNLTEKDIHACLDYAAHLVQDERTYPLGAYLLNHKAHEILAGRKYFAKDRVLA